MAWLQKVQRRLSALLYKGDAKRGIDTSAIVKTKDFAKPVVRLKNGNYKMKSSIVYTCFSTDLLIKEAEEYVKAHKLAGLTLCTNKYAPAPNFYRKNSFKDNEYIAFMYKELI